MQNVFHPSPIEVAQGLANDYGYRLRVVDGDVITRRKDDGLRRRHPNLADAIATMVSEYTGISKAVALASYEDL